MRNILLVIPVVIFTLFITSFVTDSVEAAKATFAAADCTCKKMEVSDGDGGTMTVCPQGATWKKGPGGGDECFVSYSGMNNEGDLVKGESEQPGIGNRHDCEKLDKEIKDAKKNCKGHTSATIRGKGH